MKNPPYGKALMARRLAGQSPDAVYVVTDWNLAKAFTRIVLPDDLQIDDDLELRFLAGLDVVLAHHEADEPRLPEIKAAILRCNPHLLNVLDVDERRTTILKKGAA